VLEMAAQYGELALRTRDNTVEPPATDALHVFNSEPMGINLLQFDFDGGLFALATGCTPTCGDWLEYTPGVGSIAARWTTPQSEVSFNALAVPTYGSVQPLWARGIDATSTVLRRLDPSGAAEASIHFDTPIIGLTTDHHAAFVATEDELIQFSLPDFGELGRIPAKGVAVPGHGALLRRSAGTFLVAETENARMELRLIGWGLEVAPASVDVFDAVHFAEEFDEVFFSTPHGIEKVEYEGDALTRRVIATSQEPAIQALAYDEPYLYVALLGTTPEGVARTVVQALSIGACTDGIR
jgi:hypothetical protein